MKIVRHGDTYVAPKGAFFDGNVHISGNFIIPPDTHIWGRLDVDGRIEMGAYSSVGSDVTCDGGVIGKAVNIKGSLEVLEDITLSDDARVREIRAGGNVTLRPGVCVGDVTSDEIIYVVGKVQSGTLTARQVKVVGNGV